MTRNTAPRTRRGLRSRKTTQHITAATQTVAIPASRTELDEAHIWAVNAAMENGQTDLAYELADSYLGV